MSNRTFASDNYSGVHPEIMSALVESNTGHASSYSADSYTGAAIDLFKKYFGEDIEVFFVYNGTGANVLGLQAITQSYNSIICSELAHINVDESTAPEKFTGCKLITIPTQDGKIYPRDIEAKIQRVNDQHHPQVRAISISQPTEYGTVYSIEEIKAIAAVAQKYNLIFHVDGARISNAAVSLQKDFRSFTRDVGVDVLSFGGTKNGLMFGEAVVFFNLSLAANFKYFRKQGMQLHSKGRFIGAQFKKLLEKDLWKQTATHANAMAKRMEKNLTGITQVKITQRVDANGVFVIMPRQIISELQATYFFYVWNEKTSEVRLMCSFDTTEEDVDDFTEKLKGLLK